MIQSLTSPTITGNIDPTYHHTTHTTPHIATSDRPPRTITVHNTDATDTTRERAYAHTTQTDTPNQWYARQSTRIVFVGMCVGCSCRPRPRASSTRRRRRRRRHRNARRPSTSRLAAQGPCRTRIRASTTCHAGTCSSEPATNGRWPDARADIDGAQGPCPSGARRLPRPRATRAQRWQSLQMARAPHAPTRKHTEVTPSA